MSLLNSNPNYTTKQLDLVELPKKISLIIPNAVLDKIKYLCKNIPKDEWSGPLFYKVEGDITDVDNFKITVMDILPLDKGTAAFTSYQNDNRFIDFMEEDPMERLEWQMGHCHSHNVMRVFFSGTDKDELMINSRNYNYYLSLIVNNYMDMEAWVAFIGKMEQNLDDVPYYSLDDKGNPYVIQTASFTTQKEKLFYYQCDIISEREVVNVDDGFKSKVEEIMKPKYVAPATVQKAPVITDYPAYKQQNFPATNKKKNFTEFIKDEAKSFDWNDIEDDIDDYSADWEILELFVIDWLKLSGDPVEGDTLESVLTEAKIAEVDPVDFAQKAISVFPETYFKNFPNVTESEFVADTYEIADMLYQQEDEFEFIKPLNAVLYKTAKKFETIQK